MKARLLHGDCLQEMAKIKAKSIDLILADLPYGTTKNKWDVVIPFDAMWKEFDRILKPKGIVVLTSAQPFTSLLIASKLSWFRYDMIWEKTVSSGQLNVKKMPLRSHEHVLVFYKTPGGTYNEQKTTGAPYTIQRKAPKEANYGKQTDSGKVNTGFRHATSVLKVSNPRVKGGHPTQKPLDLLKRLISTYSNPKDVVLDCCMGSGSTGVASLALSRNFIGIEKDDKYFDMAEVACGTGN